MILESATDVLAPANMADVLVAKGMITGSTLSVILVSSGLVGIQHPLTYGIMGPCAPSIS